MDTLFLRTELGEKKHIVKEKTLSYQVAAILVIKKEAVRWSGRLLRQRPWVGDLLYSLSTKT